MDNIREDLLKYHQEYKVDKEGLAYAKRAIAAVNDLEKRSEANGIPTSEGMDLYRRGYRTIGNGITTRYIREGGIDLIGAEIDSPDDLAAIMQSYRNPLYETTRVFYLQKNKVIATEGISNQLPNLVTVEFSDEDKPADHIAEAMVRYGADSCYLLHNHPSGDPTPSLADISLTRNMNRLDGFSGHIVINHRKFAFINGNGDYEIRSLPGEAKDILLTPSLEHPLLGEEADTSEKVAALGRKLEAADSSEISYLIYSARGKEVRALQEVASEILLDEGFPAWSLDQMKRFGSGSATCITSNQDAYDYLSATVKDGILTDAIYIDPNYPFFWSKAEELKQAGITLTSPDERMTHLAREAIRYYEESDKTGTRQWEYTPKPGTSRLFVDLDGTLAVFTPVEQLETLYEQGYFANLKPHGNAIEGLKMFMQANPETEVFVLSSVLTDSRYALEEKQAWLDRYLPEIDHGHRIFPPCGEDKSDYVPEGINKTDILLDDYTDNLLAWQQEGGTGIKMMNGINGTKGRWEGRRLEASGLPEIIASGLGNAVRRIEMEEIIMARESIADYGARAANLIATYEELFAVDESKNITNYFGDYMLYEIKYGTPLETVAESYNKGLEALGITENEFEENDRYLSRENIILDMCEKNNIPIPDYVLEQIDKDQLGDPEEPDQVIEPAKTLKGYQWVKYGDGSGYLKNANGEAVLSYDRETDEVKDANGTHFLESGLLDMPFFDYIEKNAKAGTQNFKRLEEMEEIKMTTVSEKNNRGEMLAEYILENGYDHLVEPEMKAIAQELFMGESAMVKWQNITANGAALYYDNNQDDVRFSTEDMKNAAVILSGRLNDQVLEYAAQLKDEQQDIAKEETVWLHFHKAFVNQRTNASTGEIFNSVLIPSGVKMEDGVDIGGYSFNPLYTYPGQKNPNSVHIPLLKDREIWLMKAVMDGEKNPLKDEDGHVIKDIIKVSPEALQKALDEHNKAYQKENAGQTIWVKVGLDHIKMNLKASNDRTFHSVTIPQKTDYDGIDIGGYRFTCSRATKDLYNSNLVAIPFNKEAEVKLSKVIIGEDGKPALGEDGIALRETLTVKPELLKDALVKNRIITKDYTKSNQVPEQKSVSGFKSFLENGNRQKSHEQSATSLASDHEPDAPEHEK